MRVFVVGGTGFIGPPVVRRLVALNHHVTVLHRGLSEAVLPNAVQHLHWDRGEIADRRAELAKEHPDVVIDMAPYSEQDAIVVVQGFGGIAGRLVTLSSQDVYLAYARFRETETGPLEPVPFDESAPLRTRLFPYRGRLPGLDDYEKILVERTALGAKNLPATVIRLPAVYGPQDAQHRLGLELRRMDDGRPAIIVDERLVGWRWTRAYVDNAAEAIVLAAIGPSAPGGIYNVGDEGLTYRAWLEAVAAVAGWSGKIVTAPASHLPPNLRAPRGDYKQHLVATTTRIRDTLGYQEPVSRAEGLRRTVDWERANRAPIPPDALDYPAEDEVLATLA